jgi:hypothetical protein
VVPESRAYAYAGQTRPLFQLLGAAPNTPTGRRSRRRASRVRRAAVVWQLPAASWQLALLGPRRGRESRPTAIGSDWQLVSKPGGGGGIFSSRQPRGRCGSSPLPIILGSPWSHAACSMQPAPASRYARPLAAPGMPGASAGLWPG